jgi:hypothetical protein
MQMLQVLLDASLSEILPELGPPLTTVETAFLEFKPSPSKTPLLLLPVLTQSVYSHQTDNIIASLLQLQTSYTILMLAQPPAMFTTMTVTILLVLLMDVSSKETICASEPQLITNLPTLILSHSP